MNETNFCYWLKGFFELTDSKHLTEKQIAMIKEHLDLVFTKKTKISISSDDDNDEIKKSTLPKDLRKEFEDLVEKMKREKEKTIAPYVPYEPFKWFDPVTNEPYTIKPDVKVYCHSGEGSSTEKPICSPESKKKNRFPRPTRPTRYC